MRAWRAIKNGVVNYCAVQTGEISLDTCDARITIA